MSFPNLSALAVRESAVTLFFLIMSVVFGLYAFLALGRAEDPAFTVRIMVVSVNWPGATPAELRDQVVDRLEKRIQEVEHLYRIETTIRPGQANLQVEFLDSIPEQQLPQLFYEVRKRMQDEAPNLPPGVIGPMVNDDFSDVYFSLIALTAPGLPMRELTRDAEAIRDRLQRIHGVHKAILLGERSERIFVELDTVLLANLGLSTQAVYDAIDANNRLIPAGRVESDGPRLYLRLDTDLSDPAQLAGVPLRVGGRVIKLSDIATIRRGYEDPPTYLVRSRGQDALLLGVVMAKGENGLELGQRLAEFLATERQALPLGESLTQLTNQAEAIAGAVELFQVKFLVAVLVVVAVSMLAIGWRAGLIVGVAVPLTLGLTFVVMKALGINLDRITLGALIIALGLLVDDAIIAVEMMLVKIEEGWQLAVAAAHAWSVTAAPMLFGTLVTVSGFLPIGFARSGVGEYAGNIFSVLAIALLLSWVVAVVFVPYLGISMLPRVDKSQAHGDSAYQTPLYRRLRGLIRWCVGHRKTVIGATILLLVLAIVAMGSLVQKQFFPSSDRPEVLVSVHLPQGSSIGATDQTVKKIEAVLATLPEVETLSAYVGAGMPRFFISANPEPPNPAFGQIVAVTADAKARDRVIETLREHAARGEFAEARVRAYRLLYGPPVLWPVGFRVIGPDPLVLRDVAQAVRSIMAADPRVVDPHLEWDERAPTLHLSMDVERLQLLGMTPTDVARQLRFQFDGVVATQVRADIRTVDVVVRGDRAQDHFDVRMLGSLEVLTPEGQKLPLTQLGEIEIGFEDPVLKRYNREPFIAVRGDVRGAQPNDVEHDLWTALQAVRDRLPPHHRIEITGAVEESARADSSIQQLQPLMIAFMLGFIMLQMRSFTGTFVVVATAPLGLIGAVAALLLFNQPFGFVALLGLTGLAGILMRNTLILTQQVSDNFEAGMSAFDGVVEAAVQRARPVVLTAVAAVLAFIPLTHDSFWGPLAYVLIGGVALGTVITLLFVPALYALWFKARPSEAK